MIYPFKYMGYKMNAGIHVICIFCDHLFFLLKTAVIILCTHFPPLR